jgi:hypothetical protein
MAAQPIARLRSSQGRVVHVVRWPFAITLHDHPNPIAHSGYAIDLASACSIADALSDGHAASVNTHEGVTLVLDTRAEDFVALRPGHGMDDGWSLPADELRDALIRAVGEQSEPNTDQYENSR